jgi:hypothetical protein
MVPYQLNTYSVWQQLTSHISAQSIARIAPAQVLSNFAGRSSHSHLLPIRLHDQQELGEVLRRAVTCCETAVMQGSTSIMAEADPAVLRQPTAAEQRLDTSLKQQRSNGAACAAYSVGVLLVTQLSCDGGFCYRQCPHWC